MLCTESVVSFIYITTFQDAIILHVLVCMMFPPLTSSLKTSYIQIGFSCTVVMIYPFKE